MKSIALALLVVVCALPLRADILANNDFADGRAHWKGDAQLPDDGTLTDPSAPAGVVITLKKDKWTKIYQVFTSKEKKLRYTVSFKLSPDYEVTKQSTSSNSGDMASPAPGLDDIEGIYPLYLTSYDGAWTMVAYEFGLGSTYIQLRPNAHKTDIQTLTGEVRGFVGPDEKMLLIAFPPGEGSVTLTKFSLSTIE